MASLPFPAALVIAVLGVAPSTQTAVAQIELPRIPIPIAYDQNWLAEVEVWITPEEREIYTSPLTSEQRQRFRQEFWRARDASPRSIVNEVKEHARHHLGAARQRGLAPSDPRFRAIVLFGAPLLSYAHGDCHSESAKALRSICVVAPPFEVFDYGDPADVGVAPLLFVRHPNERLGPCVLYRSDLVPPFRLKRTTPQMCNSNSYLLDRAERALSFSYSWGQLVSRGLKAPPVRSWARKLAREGHVADVSSARSPRLLLSALEELESGEAGVAPTYRLDLRAIFPVPSDWSRDGVPWRNVSFQLDVLKGDERTWTKDSVRTEVGDAGPELGLDWSLQVPAGSFQVVAHAEDEAAEMYVTGAWQLEVPAELDHLSGGGDSLEPVPGLSISSSPGVDAVLEHPWVLLPPLDGAWFGPRDVHLQSWSEEVESVAYFLDDVQVADSSEAPFVATVDFGPTPRQWSLRVEARSRTGQLRASDEVLVNHGVHQFALELEQLDVSSEGRVSVRGRVLVPADANIESVRVLDADGESLFVGNQGSFVLSHQLDLDESGRVRPQVLTAVVVLDDARSREQSLLVGAESSIEIDVELVELYASFSDRRGRPITDLELPEVSVFENGAPQDVKLFRRLDELPINVVLLLDTSTSMKDDIEEVRASGIQFLDQVIKEDDLASVVSFSHRAYVVAPLTSDLEALAEGSRALRAWGGTSYYDSLVLALFSLQGLEGKKAVIVVSDGADQNSRVSADELLEYAERSNAAVYTISLGSTDIAGGARQARQDLRAVAERTGGASFAIRSSARLSRVYREIEADLRSQYFIAYQSSASRGATGREYRSIRVESSRSGVRVGARPGYYP